jgi:acetylornithine/N-succinyldiaminopimelate aminotransferase
MNKAKSEIVKQVSPYLKRYKDKIVVVKYGGNAMKSEELKQQVMEDISLLWSLGIKVVLVHGGGPEINSLMERLGKVPEFIDGLRVTDKETVDIVQMVLAGKVNKGLVNLLGKNGNKAIGLSGMDGGLLMCKQKDERLGFVGDVVKVNTQPILDLIDKGYIPVISTIGADEKGNAYNINGDTATCYIAGALNAERLIMMTDIAGILKDKDDPSTLISEISVSESENLKTDGIISGGMIPKVECAVKAVNAGVNNVAIIDGRVPHSILKELVAKKGTGTNITKDKKMNIQEMDKKYIASTYNRFPVTIVSGKGSIAVDDHGKQYIDMGTGIGVTSFGYCDDMWQDAITEQIHLVQHTSNLYYTEPCAKLAELLTKKTGMSKVFFSNSGAEANECAIKAARKYAFEKKGAACYNIVTLWNGFHGRTLTTLAATGQEHYHELFQPLTPGFKHIHVGDIKELKSVDPKTTAAIMIECIQGEGGVNVLPKEYVKAIEDYCKQNNILLIVDEVQTGNGRTGEFYSYMNYGVKPDIVSTAKGLAGGLPMGATMLGDKVKDVFAFGDHGSTFGGNPVAAAGAVSIVKRIDQKMLDEVKQKGKFIKEFFKNDPNVEQISGIGLMVGIKPAHKPAAEVVKQCMNQGVLCLTAKDKVRLLPALNIPLDTLKKALEIIKSSMVQTQTR